MNALILAAALLLISAPSFAQSVHGVFRVVKGEITVTSKSGTAAKAKIGQKVFPSDKIKAGADSRAKIVMIDKNEINISPDSEIVIENYTFKPEENKKNVLINVLYGKVRAKVEQKYDEGENKFQIKTPTAVAGVRGTDFITGFNAATKESSVITFKGKVEFGLPGKDGTILNPVFVTPGMQSSMQGSAPPPPPVEVPKTDLKEMDKSSDADKVAANAPAGGPAPGPGPGPGAKPEERSPASPGSMITNDDLPAKTDTPPPVPVVVAPTGGPLPIPKEITGTRDAVETKNRLLKIDVSNRRGTP